MADEEWELVDSNMSGVAVYLNVYNVSNTSALAKLNQFTRDMLNLGGVFHAAVHLESHDREWSYGATESGSGVYCSKPRADTQHAFKETIEMGYTQLSQDELRRILAEMMAEWHGADYNLLNRNCCSFSNQLCEKLGVGPIPSWVNRFATAGTELKQSAEAGIEAAKGAYRDMSERAAAADEKHKISQSTEEKLGQVAEYMKQLDEKCAISAGLANVSAKAGEVKDATAKAFERTKLEAENSYAERQILVLQEQFGVDAWEAFMTGDQHSIGAALNRVKPQIDSLNEQISQRRLEIEQLQR